jgi:predicted CXXCH cytochrome family protein
MFMKDGARFMRLVGKDGRDETYRLTRVIGGRTREDFVGRLDGKSDADEVIMPASWVFPTKSWRYKGYSVMEPERPGMRAGPVWRETCLFCHNTTPYLSRVLGKLFGDGAPGYAGGIADQFLPADRLPTFAITDEDRLDGELDAELRFLGFKPPAHSGRALIKDAIAATRQRFGADQLVEVGIGCEACHGGAKAHADDPRQRPTFEVRSDAFRVESPAGPMTPAEEVNRTCARCHTVLFSGYEDTWEGGKREVGQAGGTTINSGEARDFLLGGCWRQMACSDCHDPHTKDGPDRYAALEGDAGTKLCTRCHGGKDYGPAHSHHQTVGCVGCHMPRKNTGLDYRLTRYHRIGSPDDPARVEHDRPLECALCHADKTVASLTGDMQKWWGRSYDPKKLAELYGSLDANVLTMTILRGKAHEQAAAAGAAGDAKLKLAQGELVQMLVNPFPLMRGYARKALEQIEGRPLVIDLDAPPTDILTAAGAWISK